MASCWRCAACPAFAPLAAVLRSLAFTESSPWPWAATAVAVKILIVKASSCIWLRRCCCLGLNFRLQLVFLDTRLELIPFTNIYLISVLKQWSGINTLAIPWLIENLATILQKKKNIFSNYPDHGFKLFKCKTWLLIAIRAFLWQYCSSSVKGYVNHWRLFMTGSAARMKSRGSLACGWKIWHNGAIKYTFAHNAMVIQNPTFTEYPQKYFSCPSGVTSKPDSWEKYCSSRELLCWKFEPEIAQEQCVRKEEVNQVVRAKALL